MRAVIFPGQGSQYVGMGLDFYNKFESVKKTFDIVDKTLGFSLTNIIFSKPNLQLVELIPNNHDSVKCKRISKILNFNYKRINLKQIDPSGVDGDIRIEISELNKILQSLD